MNENGAESLPFEPPEEENIRLREENARLRRLLTVRSIPIPHLAPESPFPPKTADSTVPIDKEERARRRIALFRNLFRGREDVYARRWENDDGRHGYMPAIVKDWKAINKSRPEDRTKIDQKTRKFLPVTDAVRKKRAGFSRPTSTRKLYDRFFPNQDTMPKGGFGNLIALPLQFGPRKADNSVFIDPDFRPYPDQCQFLSTIRRLTAEKAEEVVTDAKRKGDLIGVGLSIADDDGAQDPWTLPPSGKRREKPIDGPLPKTPKTVHIVRSNLVYVESDGLPRAMLNRLLRLAAFQNPEFRSRPTCGHSERRCPELVCPKGVLPTGDAEDRPRLANSSWSPAASRRSRGTAKRHARPDITIVEVYRPHAASSVRPSAPSC